MKIRKVRREDIEELLDRYIDFLNYTNNFGKWIYKKRPKINKDELKRDIEKQIKNSNNKIFLVIEDNSKLVGFVSAELIPSKTSKTDKKVIEIIDIYSKNKRKNVGKKLLKAVEKWAKLNKAEFLQWEFIYGNKSAENFCLKNKFKYFKVKMLKKIK